MAKLKESKPKRQLCLPAKLVVVSWHDLLVIAMPVILVTALAAWLAVKFIGPAPQDTIVMLAGPKESSYFNIAGRYAKIIARSGVKVQVIETEGAQDNLRRLADRKAKIDVGFVLGGVADGIEINGLMSLGSVFVQPVMVFYRGKAPVDKLVQLNGKRIAVGPEGSGTHALAMKFLVANGIDKAPTQLLALDGD